MINLFLANLPLYPSISPGSPGFSLFLLSPARASATSNIVTPLKLQIILCIMSVTMSIVTFSLQQPVNTMKMDKNPTQE